MPLEAFQRVKGIIQSTSWNSLHLNRPSQISSRYLYGSEFQAFTDNNLLTYVLTTAKLDATGHRWVAALSNYTFSITYKPGKGHVDADALSCIRWHEAIDIDTQTVHAVCKVGACPTWQSGNTMPGAQAVDALCQDNAPPGMTPMQWCQAQAKRPSHTSNN